MVLRVYYDLMSQPSRALILFLKAANIPFEEHLVDLRKGAHLTDEYRAINPFQMVPAITHNDMKLSESVAIFQYLSSQYPVSDHWFPADPEQRARVLQYMSWQQLSFRLWTSLYFRKSTLKKKTLAVDVIPFDINVIEYQLDKALTTIEELFLVSAHGFLNGAAKPTVADLLAVCEIEQALVSGYDLRANHSRVADYVERVRSYLQPHYDDVHRVAHMVRDRVAASKI